MEELKHISLPVKMNFDENFDSDKFLKVVLTFAHDGINPNKTRFTIKDLTSHKDSLFLSPLLGNIVEDEEGNYAFGKHDMEFRPNPFQDNKMQTYYIENIIGIIPPENEANFSTIVIDGRNYVTVIGYLYKGYSNFAEDIIKQYDQVPISMEIEVFKYTFDAKAKVYDIQDFAYRGITFLHQECGTGMIGANAQVFSQSDFYQIMFTMQQDLKVMFNSNNSNPDECNKELYKEGGNDVLEEKVTNANETPVQENSIEPTIIETPIVDIEPNEPVVTPEAPDTNEPSEPIAEPAKFSKTFELSHDDVRCGLYALLDKTEETDNEWYFITSVYDTYFEYSNCDMNKHYRQNYIKDNDNITFDGERVEFYIEKLTATEKAALETMRTNYEAEHTELETLRQFKANYDASVINEQKEVILGKWESKIGEDVEAFKQLKADYSNISVDELEIKCKCIFADVKCEAENAPVTKFSSIEKDTGTYINIPQQAVEENKPNSPYGNLYDIVK
jgi:hypothetical protein